MVWLVTQRTQKSLTYHAMTGRREYFDCLIQICVVMKQHCTGGKLYALLTKATNGVCEAHLQQHYKSRIIGAIPSQSYGNIW